jgi:hypothetical protein
VNWRAVQKAAHNDVQIALENVVRANAWTLLHFDRQQEDVTRIIKLTRASVSNYQKSVVKKFETLIVKHVVPNVN